MTLLWVWLALLSACVTVARDLSPQDLATLEELREETVDEVGGFEPGVGQPSTLLLTLVNDRRAVCKNGRLAYFKMEQLVNEVFAFYLDRLLGLNMVPPATILEYSGRRWRNVRDRDILQQHWQRGDPMVCSEYLDDLEPAKLPKVFSKQSYQLNVPDAEKKNWSASDKTWAERWGAVILFDFMMGNPERLGYSLDQSADGFREKAKRKTHSISMQKCAKDDCAVNSALVTESGQLVLVDNNAGFFYDRTAFQPADVILSDMCIFPKDLVERLQQQDGHTLRRHLNLLVNKYEPEGPVQNSLRTRVFGQRYEVMMKHIAQCQQKYGRVSF